MKYLVLLFLSLPFVVASQSMYNDPRGWKPAPADNVKSMTITGLIETKRDAKPDSLFQEVRIYGEDGREDKRTYRTIIDKSTYRSETDFHYWDGGFDAFTYVNGKMRDSVIVRNDTAWRYFPGGYLKHMYAGDTVTEAETKNCERVIDEKRCLSCRDSFWDYRNNGKFASRVVKAAVSTDTIRYLNDKGETMLMIVNYYSESRHVILSEYYNYEMKTFEFSRYSYSDTLDLTYYIEKSKKGRPSYTVARKYNEAGLLVEERETGMNKRQGILVKQYSYTYY